PQALSKRLYEIVNNRGKKNIDINNIILELKFLETKAEDVVLLLRIQVLLVLLQFDASSRFLLSLSLWTECLNNVNKIMNTLENNSEVKLSENDVFDDSYEY